MIKIQDLKVGDYVIASFDGKEWKGEVTGVKREDKQARVKTEVQEFWFPAEDLTAIPLNEEQLLALGFERQLQDDGAVKYLRGPFRVLVPLNGDFSRIDMWYREDRRHITRPLFVHEFQNYYLEMTKVELHPN